MPSTASTPVQTAIAFLAGLLWSGASTAALSLPDTPLFLSSTGVAPNIVLTLDDSGSMAWGYIPDALSGKTGERYAKSSYNPAYYNPAVVYRVPPDADGNPPAAPKFTAAYINGFDHERGVIDLSNAYRPTKAFDPKSGGTHSYMDHTVGDPLKPGVAWDTHEDTGMMIGANAGTNAPYFVIDDFEDADGSASGNDPGTNVLSVQVQGQATPAVRKGEFDLPCKNDSDPEKGNQFYTNISGGRLSLCFRDVKAMYGKEVTVKHKVGGGGAGYVPVAAVGDNTAAYYYLLDNSNPGCDGSATDNDCYDPKIVGAQAGPYDHDGDGDKDGEDEKQNFANWYSFYRTRNLMTVSAVAMAFQSVPAVSRVAWQALNSCRGGSSTLVTANCDGWEDLGSISNAINLYGTTQKQNLYSWLLRLPASGWTPLRQAAERVGAYYGTKGQDSPYDNDLEDDAENGEYSCRRNFHVLMTDGVWNINNEKPDGWTPGHGNYDSDSHDLPDGSKYTARRPYLDTNDDSLADIAFYYWAVDLRPDLTDLVPSYVTDFSGNATAQYFNPRNDPADWQHMVNYTVGLGLTGFFAVTDPELTWDGDTFGGSYAEILSGSKDWPTTVSNNPGNVPDLWHAAINSRGRFYSADTPEALVSAFQEIVDTISTVASSGGGAGLSSNTTQIDQVGALIFEAKFNADWSGRLFAKPIQGDFSLGTEYWDAGQKIPAPHDRRIFTTNGGTAEAFTTCSGDLDTALDRDAEGVDDGLCAQRLNWLRGDGRVEKVTWSDFDAETGTVAATYQVKGHGFAIGDRLTISDVAVSEDPAPALGYNGEDLAVTAADADTFTLRLPSAETGPGTYSEGGRVRYTQFRDRPISVLGDIMGSDPVYVSTDDFGYGGGASTLEGKAAYADFVAEKKDLPPMLYVGANDGMLHGFRADTGNVQSGVELLAYVPAGVYDNGIDTEGVFHGLSALTDPYYAHQFYVDGQLSVSDAYLDGAWGTYLTGSLGAGGRSVFALDVTDPEGFDAGDVKWEFSDPSDLGFTFSRPQIAPIAADQWAVIFGNGYNSTGGEAVLYVVDLADGSQVAKVRTFASGDNGLSTPILHDSDGDTIVDAAYAGDLKGNLWKFVNLAGVWSLGNGGKPLFSATNADGEVQPISSQPKLVTHPLGGVLIYFGTGSYLTYGDLDDTKDSPIQGFDDQQAFYAIWDKPDTTGTVARGDLQAYHIIEKTKAFDFTVRTTSAGSVVWTTQRGWYLELPDTPDKPSERIVSTPLVMEFTSPEVPDRVLFVTNTPASDPCSRGGTTWLMELDLIGGGRTPTSVFDLNGDKGFDNSDLVALPEGGGGGDGDGDGVEDEEAPVSGVALPADYAITGEPLLLEDKEGNIVKEFSGSSGKSGTAEGPLQKGDPPEDGEVRRIQWRQIL